MVLATAASSFKLPKHRHASLACRGAEDLSDSPLRLAVDSDVSSPSTTGLV